MSDAMPTGPDLLSVFADLRRRVLRITLAIGVGAAVGLYFSSDLLLILKLPFLSIMGQNRSLYFTAPHESFMAHLWLGLIAGLLLAAPYVFLQIWWIASPVLYRKRRIIFFLFAMASALVFVLGAVFGYFGILPAALDFLVKRYETGEMFTAMLKISSFMNFSLKLLLVFGLGFELPVLMVLLGRLGIVNARMLWRGFRYAVVIIAIAAAALTPPDVVTQLMLAGPLVLLYVMGMALVAVVGKRRTIFDTDEPTD
ncbi:MAG: twin-arginine translocase subunit TatC [Candidatus Lernaella stagnicola]|nr:twin-arginine translocase subunit TatC [Candidatus Lernaella stagnicola]